MTPDEFDQLAKQLHHEWESPDLLPRIAAARPRPRRRRWAAFGIAAPAASLAVAIYLVPTRRPDVAEPATNSPLLSEQALAEVQQAEKSYRQSIDRLSRVAAPKLQQPATPLLRAYAEKLAILDEAIGGLRGELASNGFNTHLHMQMAALYRDKQKTLEQVLAHD